MSQEFDEQQFLDAVQTAVPATKFTPIPAGTHKPARVKQGSIKVNTVAFKEGSKGGVNIPKADGSTVFGGKEFEVHFIIDDPQLAESVNMQEPSVRYRFWLDVVEGGALASGVNQNVKLGNLLALAGVDLSKGDSWSFRDIERVANVQVQVSHRPDKKDPEIVYADVVKVAPL